MIAEPTSTEVFAETSHEAFGAATPAVNSEEVADELPLVEAVAFVPDASGERRVGDTLRAEHGDPQPVHPETPSQASTPTHALPLNSTGAVQPAGLPIMLLSLVVVFFVGLVWRSARSLRNQELAGCQSQAACSGTPVPIFSTGRKLGTVARPVPLPRAVGDADEQICEMPSPGAEGTACGVSDEEPRLRGSAEAVPALEHKSAADVLPLAVSRVATPSRVRAAGARGEQGFAESVPQQLSF